MTSPIAVDLVELASLGTQNLRSVIAIDSHSDERSETIPSTEGQRRLSSYLEGFFRELGFAAASDEFANLLVDIPGNVEGAPALALMVHMDTARGTEAVEDLCTLASWDGSRIPFPRNDRLEVSLERYPETRAWLGHDLLFGPGERPVGFDDKLGMSELMTMAQVLARGDVRHGPLVLVFRPDEEIGRMQAVHGLVGELTKRGVRFGFTVDGLSPFEVNVENFNASRAFVRLPGKPLDLAPLARTRVLRVKVNGAKSHGATAKAEGYKNATVLFAEAFAPLSRRQDVLPVGFASDHAAETDAELAFLLRGDDDAAVERAEKALLSSFEEVIASHRFKGAGIHIVERHEEAASVATDAVARLFAHLATFLRSDGPEPQLSEDSDGHQGYSNPCFVHVESDGVKLEYRLRAFDGEELRRREEHIRAVASEGPGDLPVDVHQQYVNMGPRLSEHPELVAWAREAAAFAGEDIIVQPIRGGTGVDPFLDGGIPVANLGTGYFAPESEKELTSRQYIARHARWLCELVSVVATKGAPRA